MNNPSPSIGIMATNADIDTPIEEPQQWRWGAPLSRAEAEGLARRWAEGDVISEVERWNRTKDAIMELIDKGDKESRFYTLSEVRQYMAEKGLKEMTSEVDDNLLAHTLCEAECARRCRDKTGPDADECFWPCMQDCSPVATSGALEGADPSPVEPDKFNPAFFSTPSGVIVPKNLSRRSNVR